MYNKLTKNDIDEMQKEIDERKMIERPKLLEIMKEMKAHGDLSENFEYHAAKKEKNKNEGRIRFLERMIQTCEILVDSTSADQVGIGKTIKLFIEEDSSFETYKLVSSMRVDSLSGLITTESPLGKSILGKRLNERVFVPVNETYGYYVVIKNISEKDNVTIDKMRTF